MLMKIDHLRAAGGIALAALAWLLVASPAFSTVPSTMTYQARLTEPVNGNPLSGTYNMRFRIYPDSVCAGPGALWEETHNNSTQPVVVDGFGMFEVLLGEFVLLSPALFPIDGAPRYLEVEVNGEVLCPRKVLNSVPYAFAPMPTTELWQTDGANVFRASGNVGIGTATPQASLHVGAPSGSNSSFFLSDDDLSHPATNLVPANVYARMASLDPSTGDGLMLEGFSAGDKVAFRIRGNIGSMTPTKPAVLIAASKGNNVVLDPTDTGFAVDSDANGFSDFVIMGGGNVGIGTTVPTEKLQVAGVVHSTTGGFKFPDGSVQTTAAPTLVDRNALKTAIAEVSTTTPTVLTLPGGEYSFYPQVRSSDGGANAGQIKIGGTSLNGNGFIPSSYGTYIAMIPNGNTLYAQARYVTASGMDYWLFLLVKKIDGSIVAAMAAPDHPAYGDGNPDQVPHPFIQYDRSRYEVALVDAATTDRLRVEASRSSQSILSLLEDGYRCDMTEIKHYRPLHTGQFVGGRPVLLERLPREITVRGLIRVGG